MESRTKKQISVQQTQEWKWNAMQPALYGAFSLHFPRLGNVTARERIFLVYCPTVYSGVRWASSYSALFLGYKVAYRGAAPNL
jgi:hypothetical protein